MMAILVEETDNSDENNSRDNHKAVLRDDLENHEYEFKDGTAGESARWRLKSDPEESKECVEEQEEKREE
ncbi:hypothetical protein C451_00465 [Halococcus thailandensis JCM 13552]|uniref:Uncharacterized protein n=1 Tax=Halococcus thailandensis JCM 13552 TaxID=1227457 RepID=M0NG45_9EURY|nr:hypothetical protein C451_00465 [Halococcus thailandensis JCM 13552]